MLYNSVSRKGLPVVYGDVHCRLIYPPMESRPFMFHASFIEMIANSGKYVCNATVRSRSLHFPVCIILQNLCGQGLHH